VQSNRLAGVVPEVREKEAPDDHPEADLQAGAQYQLPGFKLVLVHFRNRPDQRQQQPGLFIQHADREHRRVEPETARGDVLRAGARQRLAKFGLKIAQGESRTIGFGRYRWQAARQRGQRLTTFDFLGFTHYCDRTRQGGFKVGRKTNGTRLNRALVTINEWLKWIRNQIPVREWWPMLADKLRGHYCYCGVRGNTRSLHSLYYRVLGMAYKWLNRRSQKAGYTWEQYCRRLRFLPLPLPRIYQAGHNLADGLPKIRMTEIVTSGSVRGAYRPSRLKWLLLERSR
jgi:hypothetical protein